MDSSVYKFSSTLPITVLVRPADQTDADWQVIDQGPGFFNIPAEQEVSIRIKSIDDRALATLAEELVDLPNLRYLNLSENRNITDFGLAKLVILTQLTALNLSSCSITGYGLAYLKELPHLAWLDLSYCNRITDNATRELKALTHLAYLNLQACFKFTIANATRLERRGLTIHR
jgi:Leucine-rich repeat (LRR) protein